MGLVTALVVLVGLPLSFPLFAITNILPGRWFAFSYPILSIVAAVALFTVISHIEYRRFGSITLLCLVVAIAFFMITNNISNMDSPIYASQLNERMVYTESEMAAGEWAVGSYDGRIITDYRYGDDVMGTQHAEKHLNMSYRMLGEEQSDSGLVIWRDILAERPALIISEGSLRLIVMGETFETDLAISHNLIYANNTSKMFLARGR